MMKNIYLKFKKFIEDFNEFILTRRVFKYSDLSSKHKNVILSYDKESEKEMNSLILKNLSQEMLD